MVSEIQKSQKVREKSGNFKIMVLLKSKWINIYKTMAMAVFR